METPRTYEEFWPYYVSQHMDPTCRKLHVVGTTAALGLVAVSPLFPLALLAAPIVGYGLAWIGHFGFEKNRPATWGGLKFAAWSLRSDFRMLRYTFTGRMEGVVREVGAALEADARPEQALASP